MKSGKGTRCFSIVNAYTHSYWTPPFQAVPSIIPDVTIDGKELFTTMMAETARLDPNVFLAIQKLKGILYTKESTVSNDYWQSL